MTIITGTADFQQLFQGLLAEVMIVGGQSYGVPIVKLSTDSQVSGGSSSEVHVASGTVSIDNFPALQIVSGSIFALEFPTYAEWDYFGETIYSGTNLYHCRFRRGGASGTILATLDMTYDSSNNLLTMLKT